MKKTVSVIVPFYNAQNTIEKCVKTIQLQTYKELQIILIDDGSKDNGFGICQFLAQRDKRILLIKQENKGVSATRNLGLDMAVGEYCCFVDADDFIDKDYVKYMVNILEENDVDLSTCAYQVEYEHGKWKMGTSGKSEYLNIERGLINFFSKNGMRGTPCCKLFKMEILNKYGVRFNESIRMAEDKLFCYEYITKCDNIFFSSEAKYYYVLNVESASNKKYVPTNLYDGNLPFKALREIEKDICNHSDKVVNYYMAFASKVYIRMVFKYNLFSYLSKDEINQIRKFIKRSYKVGEKKELFNSRKNYIFGLVIISSTRLTKWICTLRACYTKRI